MRCATQRAVLPPSSEPLFEGEALRVAEFELASNWVWAHSRDLREGFDLEEAFKVELRR